MIIMRPLDWILLVCFCIGFIGATITYFRTHPRRGARKDTDRVPLILPALPAGLELDRRMAEEFMGLIPCDQWEGRYPQSGALLFEHLGPSDHRCYRRHDPAPYSQSWAVAGEVLEQLRRRKCKVVVTLDGRQNAVTNTVTIDNCPPVAADSLSHAIAWAALNTVHRKGRPMTEEA